jgi:mRNA interferase MazF
VGSAKRGEVWLVDLGIAAKIRPCLVLSVEPDVQDRALATLVIHMTAVRTSRFEVSARVRFLKSGAFDAQNLVTVPLVKLQRRLGVLPAEQMATVEGAVRNWLRL